MKKLVVIFMGCLSSFVYSQGLVKDSEKALAPSEDSPSDKKNSKLKQTSNLRDNLPKSRVARWLFDLIDSHKILPIGSYPLNIALVSKLPKKGGKVKFIKEKQIDLADSLFFRFIDVESYKWSYKLNPSLKKEDPLTILKLLSEIDTVVTVGSGGVYKFYQQINNKKKLVFEFKDPKLKVDDGFSGNLLKKLNWDGVVLAQKGDEILVASSEKILANKDIQALVIKSSKNSFSLSKRNGSGLFALVESYQSYAIFKVVILADGLETTPVGSKLIIERKK